MIGASAVVTLSLTAQQLDPSTSQWSSSDTVSLGLGFSGDSQRHGCWERGSEGNDMEPSDRTLVPVIWFGAKAEEDYQISPLPTALLPVHLMTSSADEVAGCAVPP